MKSALFCLDTNYLILWHNGTLKLDSDSKYLISRIAYLEFLSYSKIEEPKVAKYSKLLKTNFEIIELDEKIADFAAYTRRIYSNLKTADSIILTTAISTGSFLLTFDRSLINIYEQLIN